MRTGVALLWLLTAICGSAAAGDAPVPETDERTFFADLPVVLSVSRLAQPLADAPGSVTVIDAEAIRTSGARDLADLLRSVPGFLVAQSTSGAPLAVYHGMTDENPRGLQILVDGRSQYSPLFFGGVSWNLIDVALDDIERIEVIRGSNSAAYGANAFLGVVNVVTRAAAETPGTAIRVAQGNDGVADRYARLGLRGGDASLRLSAGRQRDDGIIDANDTRRNARANLRLDLPLGITDEVQFQTGFVDLRLNAGEASDTREPPRVIDATRDFVSAAWMHYTADGGSASVRYTRSRERYSDNFNASDARLDTVAVRLGLPVPFLVEINQQISTRRDEFEFQHTLLPADRVRLVWGAGERHDRVLGRQFYGTEHTVQQKLHRVFGNLEWRPAPWVFNLGATWEDDSLSDDSLAPRLSANYHLSPAQTLRAGVTRAHRTPTLTESLARTAYGAFDTSRLPAPPVGLPGGILPIEITRKASGGLDPETIDVQEVGYLGDFRALHVFVDLRAFRERVRDRIVPVTLALIPPDCDLLGRLTRTGGGCGDANDFLNGQELDIRGLEYQLRWRPRPQSELTFNQTFIAIDAQANARFVTRDPNTAQAADRHMENSAPTHATMLRWHERLPSGVEASITHYRYARFQWTIDSAVGPFRRTDVRLASPLRLGTTRGELALVVQGLGSRRAEFRDHAVGAGPDAPQLLRARGWVGLTLGF